MRPLTLRTVLVATDLREEFVPSLLSALELARLAEAAVHVVHATEETPSELSLHDYLRAAGVTASVQGRTLRGPASATISQEAARLQADVVVLGAHRRAGKNPLGSTADRVVRTAKTPCLILPVPLALPFDRVLAPVDASQAARDALGVAMTWASGLRQRKHAEKPTQLIALHVADKRAELDASMLHAVVDALRKELAVVAGVDVEEVIEQNDDAAATILEHANATSANLVVLSTRGERVSDGAVLGSVSSDVVRHAGTPILLVPPNIWRRAEGENANE